MKQRPMLFALLLFSCITYAQTVIYNESFINDSNKGATYNTATGATDINMSSVNWSIDVSATNFDSNEDKFSIESGSTYLEARDTNGPAIWYSPITNITNFNDVTFQLEAVDNRPTFDDLEPNDTFTTEYSIDGGPWTIAGNNGALNDDIDTITSVSHNLFLAGSTIQLKVTMDNNGNDERYRLDNILISGVAPTTPTVTINPNTNLISGLSCVEGNVDLLPETFTVQGSSITNDIVITTSGSFEIALNKNGPYYNAITLSPILNTVELTTIYAKLTYGLAVNTYNDNIHITCDTIALDVNAQGEIMPYTQPADCSALLISEYHEAATNTPNEKYIELYNPTNAPIPLKNYQLARFANGRVNYKPQIRTLPEDDMIAPHSTYIIARNNSELCLNGIANYCTSSVVLESDGNDITALQNADGINLDIIGILNVNNNFVQNTNLVRNSSVQAPTASYIDSDWTSNISNNLTFLGYHINVCACSESTVTWDGTAWSNGIGPNINTPAIINGPYNTSAATSFSACRLTINAEVIITPNTFIEVEHNIINTAKLTIQEAGTLIQNNETTKFINNSVEIFPIEVIKRTAPFVAWYEYTYWGSPLADALLENLVPNTSNDRKFTFNGGAFNDMEAEDLGNNNTVTAGQDDIDDEGDDWQLYPSGIMTPGVGYATTMSPIDLAGPNIASTGVNLSFFGSAANSGKISVPIVRNNLSTLDNNWQFIGNPYPSAIDANTFFTQNATTLQTVSPGVIDGAIYFWSQTTTPSATTIGNQQINFSSNDYAIINFSANVAGERYAPNNFIPSGQGFFVNFSDSYGSTSSKVIFNNSMRITGNNDQFFRTNNTSPDNKLWLNLTSDNGVFSQIAIAYVAGASDMDDGPSYDARRYYSGGSAMLVSFADNSNIPLAIQGKQNETLSNDEVIVLGLKTGITSPTIYTIAIDHFQGDFLSDHAIYLKDNLENTSQDLTTSDYSFTSELGAFNDRFEIVFNTNNLTTNTYNVSQTDLSIIELADNQVQFTVPNNVKIKTIKILDVLGKVIYIFKSNNTTKIINLDNLSQALYIAQVELNNGQIISKKAVKK